MHLLHRKILKKDSAARVYVAKQWKTEAAGQEQSVPRYLLQKMGINLSEVQPNQSYLLFDDAQDTYDDGFLWNSFFKEVVGGNYSVFVILFCSYGSPSPQPVYHKIGTPMVLHPAARVCLRPLTIEGIGPVGLLLTHDEYLDLIDRFPEQSRKPDQGFIEYLYNITSGHVGAVTAILEMAKRGMVRHLRVPVHA